MVEAIADPGAVNPGGTPGGGTPAPTGGGTPGTALTPGTPALTPGAIPGPVKGGGDNPFVTKALTLLPKELHGDASKIFANVKDEAGFYKTFMEAQKYIGGAVRIPKPTDPPEKVDEFYKKLGRPDKAEDYKFELPDVPGITWSPEKIGTFLQVAHKAGFTDRQVQDALNWYAGDVKSSTESYKTTQTTAVQKLKEEWGGQFDRKAVLAQRAVQHYGGPELVKVLDDTGLGNNPVLIRLFADIGENLAEDGFISGKVSGTFTPDEAKKKILAIMADKENPYQIKFAGKPGHKEAVEEMYKLHEIAFGNKAAM